MDFGNKPFGLRDIKITDMTGTTQVDLPASQTLTFKERIKSGELSGDDALVSVVSFGEALEWTLEAGGIDLDAYAMLTGRTATLAGTTPDQTVTMTANAGDNFPWVKIYGKALGDGSDDIHCKIFKAKFTGLEGSFKEGAFWITKCTGIAVDDGTNGLFEFVANETATDLPST